MATKEVFVCKEAGCGRTFNSQMALLGHQGYHQNQGEYVCELCMLEDGMKVVFHLPQGLGAHMKAKHPKEWAAQQKGNGKTATLAPEPTPQKVPVKIGAPGKRLERFIETGDTEVQLEDLPVEILPTGEVSEAIKQAFAPLANRYQLIMSRQAELSEEINRNNHDLTELWNVLAATSFAEGLTPPVTGVHVAFEKRVSDSLRERMEEFISTRKNSFTAPDVSRALAISQSTGNRLVTEFREEGKIRLVGRRGRAMTYTGTTPGAR